MDSPTTEKIALVLDQIVAGMQSLTAQVGRMADAVSPQPTDKVGTPYVAKRLGQTTVWIAELARRGDIPKDCIVAGTGTGKPWKFHREKIDTWLASR